MADDFIERWWAMTPENKLELIDGQLIVSTLEGSRRIAWMLLQDYGPAMALPMASLDLWWAALEQAFDPRPRPQNPEEWAAWAATVEHDPEPPPAGPYGTLEHRRVYDLLQRGFYSLSGRSSLGRSLGRDFVIRLGENALTPDLLFVNPSGLANLYEYYLDGPPSLVIEITLDGRGEQERGLKLRLYEEAGIPEYWLLESASQQALFFRLGVDGRYEQADVDSQGVYHSTAVPGLALSLPHLWTMDEPDWDRSGLPFLPLPPGDDRPESAFRSNKDGLRWDSLPFAPRVGLQPVPIRFEEFVSWCPQAKFENIGGLWIGGSEGSRRCLGMLLMTLGLVEAVKLATPRDWVTFLHPEPYEDLVQTHTDALMARAEYKPDQWRDEDYVYGSIPEILGLSAVGDDADECRRNLTQEVRDWVLLRIARGQDPAETDH
ncbi:MAG TPA: Uma2 family endonuclease [Thermoanaerobaculia bacterium]|nr:Uma2 family endonuclease [Thermoanaerobaculia bacterium]